GEHPLQHVVSRHSHGRLLPARLAAVGRSLRGTAARPSRAEGRPGQRRKTPRPHDAKRRASGLAGALWSPAARHAVTVLEAERARGVLGERVAVALAVGGAHEGGDDLDVPLGHLARLAPEVGEAEVDVELEEVDTAWLPGHATRVETPPDGARCGLP